MRILGMKMRVGALGGKWEDEAFPQLSREYRLQAKGNRLP